MACFCKCDRIWNLEPTNPILLIISNELQNTAKRTLQEMRRLGRKLEEKNLENRERLRAGFELDRLTNRQLALSLELSNLYYRIRNYPRAVENYHKVLEIIEDDQRRNPQDPRLKRRLALNYYNAACSMSLNGDVKEAREHLRKALLLDPTHFKSVERDGDLRKLAQANLSICA